MRDRKINSYRDLLVWQKGVALAKDLYAATGKFPGRERFGLISQIRRAAVSVPSNVSEGQARRTTKEFMQFLYIAKGSLAELDTQLVLSREFGYVEQDVYEKLLKQIDELQRMIFRLIEKLGSR